MAGMQRVRTERHGADDPKSDSGRLTRHPTAAPEDPSEPHSQGAPSAASPGAPGAQSGSDLSYASMQDWLRVHNIEEVECAVPDITGIARGKILPRQKFLSSLSNRGLRLPESIFTQSVTGDYPDDDPIDVADADVFLLPDLDTIRPVPWHAEPTAQIINDCAYRDGRIVQSAPRQVLKRVLARYAELGWTPVVAPELEFYLVKASDNPDHPLEPPIGRSGRRDVGRQAYGIDAVNEFDPLFDEIYDYCEVQGIDVDTLHHESGSGQIEINFNHGDALALADQVFLFKRTVRQAAMARGVFATFMAKPLEGQPGSAMHIHQSMVDQRTGRNLFAHGETGLSDLFRFHIGGLQTYLPQCMSLLAPNVNSYRRLVPDLDAPINMSWGHDNRTVGLRVPYADAQGRRVENRLTGADANPYLAIAASLACGWMGMAEALEPTEPVVGNAYEHSHGLPRHLPDSLARFSQAHGLHDLLGEDFTRVFMSVKWAEWDAYMRVVSSWERENLLLNV